MRDVIIQSLAAFVCYPDSLEAVEQMPETSYVFLMLTYHLPGFHCIRFDVRLRSPPNLLIFLWIPWLPPAAKFIVPFRCLDMAKMIFTHATRDSKELIHCMKIEFRGNTSGHQKVAALSWFRKTNMAAVTSRANDPLTHSH